MKYLTSVRENIKNSVNINERKTVKVIFLVKFLENPRYFEYNFVEYNKFLIKWLGDNSIIQDMKLL